MGQVGYASIVSTDLHSKMKELKKGKYIIIWDSLTVAQQAMRDQLVDEYLIHICPIITEGGKRLFTDQNSNPLKLICSQTFDSGIVSLHYKA